MKIKKFDNDSPGFIGRERKRYRVLEAGKEYEANNGLAEELAYFEALVEFLCEYVDAKREAIEELSLNALMELYTKVVETVVRQEPDPKASASSGDG